MPKLKSGRPAPRCSGATRPIPRLPLRFRSWLLGPIAALAGCASPGVPHPPSLHLAAPVTSLSAARVGSRVDLRWIAPTRTTDGLEITFPTTVEVCRDLVSASPATCTPVLRIPGHPGPSTAADSLPSALTASTPVAAALSYRIRVLNAAGRAAAPSNPAFVPVGPSVAPVQGFGARPTRAGVLLEWQGAPALSGVVEVERTLQPTPGTSPAPPRPPATSAHTRTPPEPPPGDVRLRAETPPPGEHASSSQQAGDEGMLDTGARSGFTYLYTAQRVASVTLPTGTVEYRSAPAPAVRITRQDTFPPDAPRGLVGVPGNSPPPAGPSIDLSWQPNQEPNGEPNLAGYFVYRVDLSAGAATTERLTTAPAPGPAFSDRTVTPGHRYRYTVSAIDRVGNEGPRSAPVDISSDPSSR